MTPGSAAVHAPQLTQAQRYGSIVVVGGGCYGTYYLRQLRRARERGALSYARILVVDRDAACLAAAMSGPDLELRTADWGEFFARYLVVEAGDGDAIVPSPLMPHLLFEWVAQRARARWPERRVAVRAPGAIDGMPWQREGRDGTQYVSFATWTCPVNCIEPRICPHTRGERDWSMPPALAAHTAKMQSLTGAPLATAILHCTHRAYGVGMIDVSDVLAADRAVASAAAGHPASVLFGTVSHCHGALGMLAID